MHIPCIQVTAALIGVFLFNIFSTFSIYRVAIRQDESQYYNALIQYTWNVFNLIFIIKIISTASLTTRSGKYSAVLVHKAINYSTNESVIQNVC